MIEHVYLLKITDHKPGGGALPYGDVPLEWGRIFSDFWVIKVLHI